MRNTVPLENVYASGYNDSGLYIGACRECDAHVSNAVMENNALGYSGSNSSGRLIIENSVFNHNLRRHRAKLGKPRRRPRLLRMAHVTHSRTPRPTPTFEDNEDQALRDTPQQPRGIQQQPHGADQTDPRKSLRGAWASSFRATTPTLWKGTRSPTTQTTAVLAFEYPNPFTPENGFKRHDLLRTGREPDQRQPVGQQRLQPQPRPAAPSPATCRSLSNYAELFGGPAAHSINNCVSGNSLTGATFPANVEGTLGLPEQDHAEPGRRRRRQPNTS